MSEYRRESFTLLMLRYLTKNPALALSVAYALLTVCGILYSAKFFAKFDIPILKLANVSDLLASGISEPAAVLMFLGGLLVGVSSDMAIQYTSKIQAKWSRKPKGFKRTMVMCLVYSPKRRETDMLLTLSIFCLYAYVFVASYATWHSNRIVQGHGHKIVIESSTGKKEPQPLTLLGSTTSFVFTYDERESKATAIPIENLSNFTMASVAAPKALSMK